MNLINKIALLSLGFILMMDASVVAPILPKIAENYPEVGSQTIKLIITLPVIFIVIFNPISGKLLNYINRKIIVLVGLIFFTVGGIGGAFTTTLYAMLALRALMGVGLGLISPHVLGTVQALTTGDERIKLTGYVTGINNLGIIFANILAGILAVKSWQAPFFIYSVGIVLFFLTLLFFPKTEKSENKSGLKSKFKWDLSFIKFFMVAILVSVIFNTLLLNFAMFYSKLGLGDTKQIGMLMSIVTFTSFLCGFNFKNLANTLKEKLFLFSCGSLFIGFTFMSFTNNISTIIAGLLFIGLGIGTAYPLLFSSVGGSVDKEHVPFAIALITSSLYLGRFVCPVIVDNIGIILNANPLRFPFYFSSVVAGIGILNYVFFRKKKNIE